MSIKVPYRQTRIIKWLAAIFGLFLFADAYSERGVTNFTKPLPPTQRLFIDNTNLTAIDFFSAYMSDSVEDRRYAESYLLGVMDSTEGKYWCDYRTYKTITLGEEIFIKFKALEKSKYSERAAYIITHILSSKYPCRRK